MKRTFTLIFALAIALWSGAQQKQNINGTHKRAVTPRSATADERHTSLEQGSTNLATAASLNRGSMAFTEDFANGLDGNNAFGAWTKEDSEDGSIWMVATAASPAGAYSDPGEALESTTAANGWMIFDCDLFQGGEISAANPAIDVNGYLTSPVIDLSSSTSTILEFQQAFRYCCFDDKPIFVEVSNDGGVTWYVFDGAPTFTGGANDASANPLVTTIDISGVAAGQSSVQFRFGWQPNGNSTHSHYFWGVDDVSIHENTIVDDVVVSYITTGDIQNDFEFRAIPLEQSIAPGDGGFQVGTIYANLGTNPHNAKIKVEILDGSMNVLDADSVDVEMLPIALLPNPTDPLDTVYIATEWQPSAIGTYYTRTTVSFPETDENPEDNSMMKKFEVTTDEYGHDLAELIDAEMTPVAGTGTAADPFPATGYGSYYTCYEDGSNAHGISIRFDNGTDTGTPITILLLKRAEDYNLTDAEFSAGAEYDVDNAWTPNGNQSFPYYLPFDDAAELESGSFYFAGVQTIDEGTQELSVQAIAERDMDFSTGTWAETTEGDFIWFFGLGSLTDFSPAIRLILSEHTAVQELNSDSELSEFFVSPNPAVNQARVNFALNQTGYVAYEVRDITGKLMDWKNIGQFGTGKNGFNLDVSTYPAGNYMVNLVIDGQHMFTQQLSVQK